MAERSDPKWGYTITRPMNPGIFDELKIKSTYRVLRLDWKNERGTAGYAEFTRKGKSKDEGYEDEEPEDVPFILEYKYNIPGEDETGQSEGEQDEIEAEFWEHVFESRQRFKSAAVYRDNRRQAFDAFKEWLVLEDPLVIARRRKKEKRAAEKAAAKANRGRNATRNKRSKSRSKSRNKTRNAGGAGGSA